MKTKYVVLALALILALSIPLSIAALNHQQSFNMNGTGHYPTPIPTATPAPTATSTPTAAPTPTPSPAPTTTVAFTTSFQNGTQLPATFSLAPDTLYVQSGNGAPPMGYTPFLEVNVTNTGTTPINIAVDFTNINFPTGVTYNFWSDMQDTWGFRNPAGNERALATIGVGQSEIINLFGVISSSHAPDGSAFSYSLSASITATQA
jgi:hypothetical protein